MTRRNGSHRRPGAPAPRGGGTTRPAHSEQHRTGGRQRTSSLGRGQVRGHGQDGADERDRRHGPSASSRLRAGRDTDNRKGDGRPDRPCPDPASAQGRGVTLQYKTKEHLVTATYRVSCEVHKSDRFVLLGPSGCGKSTLLKAVGGYVKPVEGRINLRGSEITNPGYDRIMVFQEFDQLIPWKTIKENVMFPLLVTGKLEKKEAEEKAMVYIEKVNLTKFAHVYPHMLSGGMKQRVAIARAMTMEPDILLMDEPFAALDALTRRKMQEELLQLWEETKFTVLFVTHSIVEAIIIGTRILLLSPHPGQVKAEFNSHMHGYQTQDQAGVRRSCRTRSTSCCLRTSWKKEEDMSEQTTILDRPEYIRETLDAAKIGDIRQPLTLWEKVSNIGALRKGMILLLLACIWQAYAVWVNNPLIFPTFTATDDRLLGCPGPRRPPGSYLGFAQAAADGLFGRASSWPRS